MACLCVPVSPVVGRDDRRKKPARKNAVKENGQVLIRRGDPPAQGHPFAAGEPYHFFAKPFGIASVFFVMADDFDDVVKRGMIRGTFRGPDRVRAVSGGTGAVIAGFDERHLDSKGADLHGQGFAESLDSVLGAGIGTLIGNA